MSTPITTAPLSLRAAAMVVTPSVQPPSPDRKIATLRGVPSGTYTVTVPKRPAGMERGRPGLGAGSGVAARLAAVGAVGSSACSAATPAAGPASARSTHPRTGTLVRSIGRLIGRTAPSLHLRSERRHRPARVGGRCRRVPPDTSAPTPDRISTCSA